MLINAIPNEQLNFLQGKMSKYLDDEADKSVRIK